MKFWTYGLSVAPFFCGAAAAAIPDLQHAANIAEIANTITLFGAMVDSGDLQRMPDVFTRNCSVDFGLPGVGTLHGLPAVAKEIGIISNVTSQHSITTVHSDLEGSTRSNSTAYIIGSFFKKGANQQDHIFTVYGT